MIKKFYTCMRRCKDFRPNEDIPVIRIGTGDVVIMETDATVPDFARQFVAGDVADRLYAYESIGYTPDELHEIIDAFHKLKFDNASKNLVKGFLDGIGNNRYGRITDMVEGVTNGDYHSATFCLSDGKTVIHILRDEEIANDKT